MFKNKTTLVVIIYCIVTLVLHVIGDLNSGFSGDELLHIQTGNHPDIGYMEFPPVIGWLAFIQNQIGSDAVVVHHIFTHLASLLIIIFVALTTLALGGRTKAVFIVLLCMLGSPGFGRTQQLFQPVVFSELFWVLGFYQLVRFVKSPDYRHLLYLTITLAAGFLTKYDIVFFIAGLASLFFFKKVQPVLFTRATLKCVLLFIVLISPNIWWQYQHGFPVFNMFSRLYETQLEQLSVLDVFKNLVIALNPFTVFIWLAGAVFMFNNRNKEVYRPIAVFILLSICFLAFSKSKDYYFFSAIILLLILGSIWLEQRVFAKRKWLLYPVALILFISGLVLIPWGINVLPLPAFIKTYKIKKKDDRYKIHYQEYYSQSKWANTLSGIQRVYDSLPANEQKNCLIWGKHYSQAGAINLYGAKYKLPQAFSYHGSFYLWAPGGQMPETIIAYANDEAGIDFFEPFFGAVTRVGKVYNPYAESDKHVWETIYLCKKPYYTFDKLKELFSKRIFE